MLGVRVEPLFVPSPGKVWPVPVVGLLVDSVPVEPMVAPVAAELHGKPLAPVRPVVGLALPSVLGLDEVVGFVALGTLLGFIVP